MVPKPASSALSQHSLFQALCKLIVGAKFGIRTLKIATPGFAVCAAGLLVAGAAIGQTPVVIPNTISTLAGGSPSATTASSPCPTNANFKATDAIGNGCPAYNATFSGNEKGITVDPAGNVYVINDTASPQEIRKIDARTGNISLFVGAGSGCSSSGVTVDGTVYTPLDKVNDGCPAAYASASNFNGARGLGSDPYGNLIFGVTGDNILHLVCTAVSPICPVAAVRVNLQSVLAGCTYSSAQYGVAVTGATPGTAGDGTAAALNTTSSANCTTGVNQPRMAVGDKWDNVYFQDAKNGRIRVIAGPASITVNGATVTNPLYATLKTDPAYATVTQGYIYPMAGGFTATTKNAICTTGSSYTASDTYGDGCPFYQTSINTGNSGATVQGLAVDNEGDFIFDDANGNLRVIYEGGTVIKGALTTEGITTPVLGNSYVLIGGGTAINYNSGDPGVEKGTSAALQSGSYQNLATDSAGNVYLADQLQILFFDISTGYVRRIATANGASLCTAKTDSLGDGCPIANSTFGLSSTAVPIAMDPNNNLYILDSASSSGNKRIRLVSSTLLPSTSVNGTLTSNFITHAPVSGSTVAVSAPTTPDFTLGTKVCATKSDSSVDCTTPVTYAPKSLEQRTFPIAVATTTTGTTTQYFGVSGQSTGSALTFDGTFDPTFTTLGATATGNTAVVLDGAGNAYVSGTQGISKVSGSTVTNISGSAASYIAVDAEGSVYANAGSSATTITKYTYAPSTGTYSSGSITIPVIPINGVSTQGHGGPMVVDQSGTIYIADLSSLQVIAFSQNVYTQATGITQQITQTALTAPTFMSQDGFGQLLIVDSGKVLKIPTAGFTINASSPVTNPSVTFSPTISSPAAVGTDQSENLYVATSTGITVLTQGGYEYSLNGGIDPLSTPTASSSGTASTTTLTTLTSADTVSGTLTLAVGSGSTHSITVAAATTLSALATQINGDTTFSAEGVSATPSGNTVTISGPTTAGSTLSTTGTSIADSYIPGSLAVDGNGNLYTTKSTAAGITQIQRAAQFHQFGTDIITADVGVFVNAGGTAATGFSQTDTGGNYTFGTPSSPLVTGPGTCALTNTTTALASGGVCNTSITFSPSAAGSGDTPDTIAFTSAVTNGTVGTLSLDGTKTGANATTTTSVSGNTTGLSYSTSTETTFTITVTQSTGNPSGTVQVYVDANSAVNATLGAGSNGSATATYIVSGLSAGSHTIYATYPSASGITGSTSSTVSFTIGQDSPTVTYTPATTSVSYSAPVGTTALNATASYGGSSVPGVFVYTANGNEINAATYLAQGSYTLGVTFYPTDSTDYTSGSTASGGTFTVTQASTTAGIGATQSLVASDGTGNYTSVQSALNAQTGTGGNVYIKPGTYNGFVTVVQPNTALYGLGGVARNVILTNEDGAFSSPYPSNPIYGTTYAAVGNNGSQGDEGSATMVVARAAIAGVNGGATFTPYNFYAENLSIINSYDTDSSNSTYNYYNGSIFTAAGSPSNNQALFNSGNLCNSQALAIWFTADQSVLNNIYTTSLQDTIYAGAISGGSSYAARQYWFRGKVTGNVDYIFGDAAAVFDHTTIYSAYHSTATGTDTIEAQNKSKQTGSTGDYLSGYIMNSDVFTSQSSGMTALFFGRPYGTYSTYAMLNSYIDQVDPSVSSPGTGYIEFSGDTNLPTSTYVEYNDHTYTDPATNSNDILGVPYLGTGGSSGAGVIVNGTSVVRETTSTNPGTLEAANGGFQTSYPTLPNTTLSQIEAQQYYPIAFLGTTLASNPYNNGVTNWNPTAAIKNGVNKFVNGGVTSATAGTSVTILMRPQVPGQGAIDNNGNAVTFTIPTGTYSLSDGGNVIASGTLDASGAAYYTSSSLTAGMHSLTWTYGGDSNFTGSTSSTFTLTIGTATTTTTLSPATQSIVYGQSASITATVAATAGSYTPTGTVILTIDGTTTQNGTLSSGVANFTVTCLTAGAHTFTAAYQGDSSAAASSTTGSVSASVAQATLTVTGACSNRMFNQANVCGNASVSGYKYTDSASTVFTSTPGSTTTATRDSANGTYAASPVYTLSTFGSTNYTVTPANGSFTISGSTPQSIIFAALPNFHSGASYQLTARTTSGLGVTYCVTAGSATVSGTTLTVNAPGTVTVQASSVTDATGDYAAATPVSQSFTAQ